MRKNFMDKYEEELLANRSFVDFKFYYEAFFDKILEEDGTEIISKKGTHHATNRAERRKATVYAKIRKKETLRIRELRDFPYSMWCHDVKGKRHKDWNCFGLELAIPELRTRDRAKSEFKDFALNNN